MRYVDLKATVNGMSGVISPTEYLKVLPHLAPGLPAGARAFATDAKHYDFYSVRCVKDLTIDDVTFQTDADRLKLEIVFGHNSHELGCSHEIGCLGGTLTIVSRDLVAEWVPSGCPAEPCRD